MINAFVAFGYFSFAVMAVMLVVATALRFTSRYKTLIDGPSKIVLPPRFYPRPIQISWCVCRAASTTVRVLSFFLGSRLPVCPFTFRGAGGREVRDIAAGVLAKNSPYFNRLFAFDERQRIAKLTRQGSPSGGSEESKKIQFQHRMLNRLCRFSEISAELPLRLIGIAFRQDRPDGPIVIGIEPAFVAVNAGWRRRLADETMAHELIHLSQNHHGHYGDIFTREWSSTRRDAIKPWEWFQLELQACWWGSRTLAKLYGIGFAISFFVLLAYQRLS